MTKALAVILALVVLALGWQSWRMKEASQTIERQGRDLKTTGEKLAKTNSQLIALSILSETNNREQARLYAVAESTNALLRSRQRRIEELKREMRIYAAGLTLFCLLTLSGCANVQPSPEVLLTVNGCPRVTQCRPKSRWHALTAIC